MVAVGRIVVAVASGRKIVLSQVQAEELVEHVTGPYQAADNPDQKDEDHHDGQPAIGMASEIHGDADQCDDHEHGQRAELAQKRAKDGIPM